MQTEKFTLEKYIADEGKVFDWAEPHYDIITDEDGNEIEQEAHLYAKTIFLSVGDSIENYIEVEV